MSFLTILYTIIIQPIELLLTVVFALAMHFTGFRIGLSIIVLSVAISIISLPLYKKMEAIQAEEKSNTTLRDRGILCIRKLFRGDERFILLQILFFVAAYNFISKLPSLRGASFGIITDMGSPDGLLVFGGLTINVLPIMMTLIDIVFILIYTKGGPIKLKVQLYGMALIFLILLYRTPAGLVLYSIVSNIFLLGKSMVCLVTDNRRKRSVAVTAVSQEVKEYKANMTDADSDRLFMLSAAFLTLYIGCLIPMRVINASVLEFVDMNDPVNPAFYILFSLMLSLGTFVVWIGMYYAVFDTKKRSALSQLMCALSVWAVIGHMSYSLGLGLLSADLKYDNDIDYDLKSKIINILILLAVVAVIFLIYNFKPDIMIFVALTGTLAVAIMGTMGLIRITSDYHTLDMNSTDQEALAVIPLSRNGKNVVFIMLDRAMGTQLPYIMNEKPELKEQFAGFTYYGNTVSFGQSTNFGAPPIYGGYEYTPWNMNVRDRESLADKHNEALKVLPVLFDNNGYNVTVCDPPYAGYRWIPRLSIYDEYPRINSFITEGKFDDRYDDILGRRDYRYRRNFFCYSVMMASPLFLRGTLYDGGMYNEPECMTVQATTGISKAYGYNQSFLSWYSVLENLDDMTQIFDDGSDTFLMLQNSTSHEPTILSEPDYVPELEVDNSEYDRDMVNRYTIDGVTMAMENREQVSHYHVNVAALSEVGKWLDYLRSEGVYDNTRIVVVSDHGRPLGQFDLDTEDGQDIEAYAPLLMMKDFGDTEYKVSDEFMTNADCVSFMVKDIIDDPVNPFTGELLDGHQKTTEPVRITSSLDYDIDKNNGNRFLPAEWYTVGDDVYDTSGWKNIGIY